MPASIRPTDVAVKQGEFVVGDAGMRLRTLLGSCVAITLWHPVQRIGAMSHFLLAERHLRRHGDGLDARYGDESLELMLQKLAALGARPTECEAKIFGGGNMFGAGQTASTRSVGRRNGEAARRLLAIYGLGVRCEHLFGDGHRQVVFDIGTGDVWVRQARLHNDPAATDPAPGRAPPHKALARP